MSETSKHTPGPPPLTTENIMRITGNPCACPCYYNGQDFIFCSLHGAAPDLHKALEAMLAYGDSEFPENKAVAVNMALATIAKATGGAK